MFPEYIMSIHLLSHTHSLRSLHGNAEQFDRTGAEVSGSGVRQVARYSVQHCT